MLSVVDHLVGMLNDFEVMGLTEALIDELQSRLAYIGLERNLNWLAK